MHRLIRFKTKNELGDGYNMKNASSSTKNERANGNVREISEGRPPIAGIAVDETNLTGAVEILSNHLNQGFIAGVQSGK